MALIKTMPSENSGAQHLLLFDKTPHGAYKNTALENSGAQMYIKTFCFLIKHPVGACKNYVSENSGAHMQIKTCCFC